MSAFDPKRTFLGAADLFLSARESCYDSARESCYDPPYQNRGAVMRRREFIKVISGAAAWPITAHAQQGDRTRRIGVMMGYAETDPAAQAQVAALRQGLQKLGWEEARIRIDVRFPGGLELEAQLMPPGGHSIGR